MKPLVAKSSDARTLKVPPPYERHIKVIFSRREFGISSASICSVTIPPGSGSDEHTHQTTDEFWIITKGKGRVIVDGNMAEVESGVVVCAPANSKHQIVNLGKETLHAYAILAPAGPEEALLNQIEKRP
jgi:mannose-6-phosphate isomerase-like protein (cupin superfamily)